MWRALVVLATLAACLVTAARGRARSRLLDGDDDPLGSPGELAWQAWLLMDGSSSSAGGAEVGGARRITPKSVFIAPAFAPQSLPPCADDHKRDAAGRCVQVVHINRDAQLNFLLQRLNSMHARPPGGRIPLPARQQDLGPFRVRLRVPSPAAANNAPDVLPAGTTTTPAPTTAEPVDNVQADEAPSVSVVLVDVSKRSNSELGASVNDSDSGDGNNGADGNGSGGDSSAEVPKPVLTVWTIENNPPHETQNQDTKGPAFPVDVPATTTTEAANGSKDPSTTIAPPEEEERVSLSDALDSSEIEVALPVLVISPGTSAPLLPTTTAATPAQDAASSSSDDDHERSGANRTEAAAPEGSGEPPDDRATVVLLDETVSPVGAVSSTEPSNDKDSPSKENEDDKESGSADVMEQIEVVPISENSRHDLPLVGEDRDQDSSFSQGGFTSGLAGFFRPIPMDVLSSPSHDETPYGNPVRFPTDVSDEPQRFHLFKGNYLKFPTEHAYRYKHRPVTDTPDVKQTFWWVPSGWRIDQQRHQPALQDFWPRIPPNGDSSHFSQFNPSYHSPLPYQQRQAQYDPQWSSMKKQMSS